MMKMEPMESTLEPQLGSASTCYLVTTPIGNLRDLTFRARDILTSVDLILAEDTRVTAKLLHAYGIKTPMRSYNDFTSGAECASLVRRLVDGASMALVSDAGTPLLSDPGFLFVREALAKGVKLVPVPGASALLAALVGSGIAFPHFFFEGFLPSRSVQRRERLRELKALYVPFVLYESPHRVVACLSDAREIFGVEHRAVVARELTKRYEEFQRGTLDELFESFSSREKLCGECVVIVEAPEKIEQMDHSATVQEFLSQALQRYPLKTVVALAAQHYALPKREVYRLAMICTCGSAKE